jgi:hypothetical protein
MNAFRRPVDVYLSGLLAASRYTKQSTVAGTPQSVLHIIVPKRGRLRSCVIKQSGSQFQQNGGPLMSKFIQPGARNQAMDETRITFVTLFEHSLGTGTRSALTVFR